VTQRKMIVAGGAIALLAAALALGAPALGQPAAATQDDAPAGDPLAGRKLARSCAACHGINGIANTPDAANLAGQSSNYIVRQLLAFRSGERKNDTMSIMAASLTDAQIADVAAYFGQIQIQVTKVPGQ
jgi:cytochrome c553